MVVQALWAYPGPGNSAAQGDLTFDVGDTIEVVERTNQDWWTGRKGGVQGLFPSGFVREIHQVPQAPPSQQQQGGPVVGQGGGQGGQSSAQGAAGGWSPAGMAGTSGMSVGVSVGGGIGGVAGVDRPGPPGQARKPWGMRSFTEL